MSADRTAAPSRLEQRYRAWLRLLPAGYRARWGEEMVATFLETNVPDDPDEADLARWASCRSGRCWQSPYRR